MEHQANSINPIEPGNKDLPNLWEAQVSEEELFSDYRESEHFKRRIGKFTASENHRLMAGVDDTNEERIDQLYTVNELKNKMDQLEINRAGLKLKSDFVYRLSKHLIVNDYLPEGAMTYVEEKVVEQKTGKAIETYESYAMRRGKELEESGILLFEKTTGLEVEKWGYMQEFVEEENVELLHGHAGCTPDGRVPVRGGTYGFEGKAPLEKTHYRYLYGTADGKVAPLRKETLKTLEPSYYWQVITGLLHTGWAGWFFMFFHQDFPEGERAIIFHLKREEVEDDIEKLKRRLLMAVEKKKELIGKKLLLPERHTAA